MGISGPETTGYCVVLGISVPILSKLLSQERRGWEVGRGITHR